MMEYDVNTHPLVKLSQATQPESLVKQFQSMMLAGKAMEALTVDSTKTMIEQSYQQGVKLLEEMDKQFAYNNAQQPSLRFPFDLMDQMTKNMVDQWSLLSGLPTSAADQLDQELEQAKIREADAAKVVAE